MTSTQREDDDAWQTFLTSLEQEWERDAEKRSIGWFDAQAGVHARMEQLRRKRIEAERLGRGSETGAGIYSHPCEYY